MQWKGRFFLLVFFVFSSITTVGRKAHSAESKRPNIIIILVDTLRADYLGAYGFQGPISPNIDKFASSSFLFKRCISQAAWTKPSIATLFTSLYPESHNVDRLDLDPNLVVKDNRRLLNLPDNLTTMAEYLHGAGYQTAGFSANPLMRKSFGFGQGFDTYMVNDTTNAIKTPGSVAFMAPILSKHALTWMGANRSKPFFVYVHFMEVHMPYEGNMDDVAAVAGSPSFGSDRKLTDKELVALGMHPHLMISPLLRDQSKGKNLVPWRNSYASGVHRFDRMLGKFLEKLKKSGRMDDSIIILTSDHGEELCEHGKWGHGNTAYADQNHVPLLIRMPKQIAGKKIDNVVGLIDVLPTLLELANVRPASNDFQGRSFASVFSGKTLQGFDLVFSAAASDKDESRIPRMYSVQNERYKLVWTSPPAGDSALYDLQNDPHEQVDIGKKLPDMKADLSRIFLRHFSNLPVSSKSTGGKEAEQEGISDEEKEVLRSLGYLQ